MLKHVNTCAESRGSSDATAGGRFCEQPSIGPQLAARSRNRRNADARPRPVPDGSITHTAKETAQYGQSATQFLRGKELYFSAGTR